MWWTAEVGDEYQEKNIRFGVQNFVEKRELVLLVRCGQGLSNPSIM